MTEYERIRNRQLLDDYAKQETLATRTRHRITGNDELPSIVFLNSVKRLTDLAISADASIHKDTYCGIEDMWFEYCGIQYRARSGKVE